MSCAILSLGSNLGDREENINRCYTLIEERLGRIVMKSSNYQTEPWGFSSDNYFINSVIAIETTLQPEQLLQQIWQIEILFGRSRSTVNNQQKYYQERKEAQNPIYLSRYMDVDILFYGNKVINTPILDIPHPLVEKRDFVLIPLAEIMGNYTHPKLNRTINQLLELLQNNC